MVLFFLFQKDLLYADLQNGVDDCGIEQSKIDTMYNAINCFQSFSQENKNFFAEVLSEIVKRSLESISSTMEHSTKNAVKIIFYFFQTFMIKLETAGKSEEANKPADLDSIAAKGRGAKAKAKKVSSDDDSDNFTLKYWRPVFLEHLQDIISIDPSMIWTMGIIQEIFLTNIWSVTLQLLEDYRNDVAGVPKTRCICIDILVACSKKMSNANSENTPLVAAIIDAVCRSEHMGAVVAELCHQTQVLIRNIKISLPPTKHQWNLYLFYLYFFKVHKIKFQINSDQNNFIIQITLLKI